MSNRNYSRSSVSPSPVCSSDNSSVSQSSISESKQHTTIVYHHSPSVSSPTSATSVQQNLANRIQVVCRVRPFNSSELKTVFGGSSCLVTEDASVSVETEHGGQLKQRSYTFDQVLGTDINQQQVFQAVGVPLVEHCYQGYNATIFAYGQTGSGKSYTIFGQKTEDILHINKESGIGPRVLYQLYNLLEEQQQEFISYKCTCMMVQIYNETLTDLLNPTGKKLSISQNRGTPVIEGVSMHAAHTLYDALSLLVTGHKEREVGQTMMNLKSSRSHIIFTLVLETESEQQGCITTRRSRLNIVDLAGNERFDNAQSQGIHFQELKFINKSLSALNHVIKQLSDNERSKKQKKNLGASSSHIDYRSSKLTFLLKDCLGGSSLCSILICVSPSKLHNMETWSTLEFAKRAKNIRVKPIRHQVLTMCEEEEDLRKSIQAFNDYMQEKTKNTSSISMACTRLSKTFGSDFKQSDQQILDDALCQAEQARVERDQLRDQVKNLSQQVEQLMPGVFAGKSATEQIQLLFEKATTMDTKYEACQARFEQYTADVAKMIKSLMGKIDQLQAEERRQKFEELTQFWDQRVLHSEWLAAQQENTKLIKQIQALKNQMQINNQSKQLKKHFRYFSDGNYRKVQQPATSVVGYRGRVSLERLNMASVISPLSRLSDEEVRSPIKSEDIQVQTPSTNYNPKSTNFSLEQAFEIFELNSPIQSNKQNQKTKTEIGRLGAFSDDEENSILNKNFLQEEESQPPVNVSRLARELEKRENSERQILREVTSNINQLRRDRNKNLRRSISTGEGELMGFLKLQKLKQNKIV